MKYLLVALIAPAGIYGSRFIGGLFPGHTVATCALALMFMLAVICTITALILNSRCHPPKL